jgi:hypothetical protein
LFRIRQRLDQGRGGSGYLAGLVLGGTVADAFEGRHPFGCGLRVPRFSYHELKSQIFDLLV